MYKIVFYIISLCFLSLAHYGQESFSNINESTESKYKITIQATIQKKKNIMYNDPSIYSNFGITNNSYTGNSYWNNFGANQNYFNNNFYNNSSNLLVGFDMNLKNSSGRKFSFSIQNNLSKQYKESIVDFKTINNKQSSLSINVNVRLIY